MLWAVAAREQADPGRGRSAAALAEVDAADVLRAADYDLGCLRPRAPAARFVGPAAGSDDEGEDGDSGSGGSADDASSSEASEPGSEGAGVPGLGRCFHCTSPAWRSLGSAVASVAPTPPEASVFARDALAKNDFEFGVLEEWLGAQGCEVAAALESVLVDPNPPGVRPVALRDPRALPRGPWGGVLACRPCATSVLGDVVWSIRERIPDAELPARARGRADCWYGRACRTQSHKACHAARLNHACAPRRPD
ncbi:unnamed protein product [Prorocentrum cordatum]|uniref:Uncharacterized protein n=1 Tax=Prorocentrum cordatum TaxID=2364126 RepID=A0ABN9T8V2_9DINO|nr:unnamed protein product [Polarella glacialis]